jgi:hypothetical protein
MTACAICGADPCVNPSFCATCVKKEAEDFAARLNAKLAEQKKEQEARLAELAAKSPVAYDQERQQAAKELGVRTKTLDQEVKKRRRQPSAKAIAKAAVKVQEAELEKLRQAAGDLVTEPDVLVRFAKAIESAGLVGETSNAKILYLAFTSRLFAKPVSIAVKGVSAGGKSFTVESVLKFFPASAYFARTGFSEKALYFSDEDFRHRFIVLFEATGMASDYLSYVVRTLLSESRLSYELPVKTEEGMRPQVLEKEGPTGIVTTTTQARLHPENETRLLSLGVVDTKQQTQAVMRTLAAEKAADFDYAPWQAFQEWLSTGARSVAVPFAPWLAERIPPLAVRLRRDFGMLLSLIRAHALLHRGTRDKDAQGRIIATHRDYEAVHDLVAKLFAEGLEALVPETVRETVEAVRECLAAGGSGKTADGAPAVSLTALAKNLKLDKNSVHHRVKKATAAGHLANLETRKGKPAQIVLADPLPEEGEILPLPEALECWSASEGVKEEGEVSDGTPQAEPDKSPEIAIKPTAKTEKQPESDGLPEAAITSTPALPYPPLNASNTPTPPSDGGNGQTVWPRAIGQERPPEAVSAKVKIREVWPPAFGPEGDDIFDLE